MEADREGVDPVVQAILASPRDGVLGILADFLDAKGDLSKTVESYLGIHLRALVVRDTGIAMKLAQWFREEWTGGGGLIVLPLDRVPPSEGSGGLFSQVSAKGEGAPWVRALLEGIDLDETITGTLRGRGGRVASDGSWVEAGGVLRFGNPLGTTGLLERRDRLRRLQVEVAAAEEGLASARTRREEIESSLHEREGELDRLRGELRQAEDSFREARAQEEARSDRMERVESVLREIEGQIALSRTNRTTATDRNAEAVRERTALVDAEEELRHLRSEVRERLDLVQDQWDEVRAIESRLTIEQTRLEGELSRAVERLQDLERVRAAAANRISALSREREALQEEGLRLGSLREEGAGELERLFRLRTEVEVELVDRDRILTSLHEKVAGAEKEVREARATERSISERRHALELEARDIAAGMARVTDRLEGEWGRSFEALTAEAEAVDGVEEELRAELREVVEAIERIGPVNMLAVEEHEEESTRLDFLSKQREDLVEARNNLRDAIREINQTATRLFSETFTAVRDNFKLTFQRLFEGGECDLWLADPDDPLESAIEIHAAPRGKRTQRIDLLSGGERALTALSLLFGIYLVKPSPFCVLDEVDAPLDESNIGRFIRLLHEFKKDTQFVVITHNPRTIEAADWIYGVTMEEPGVSTIVGVRLEEAMEVAGVRV
jgi:chromosome segregation protein